MTWSKRGLRSFEESTLRLSIRRWLLQTGQTAAGTLVSSVPIGVPSVPLDRGLRFDPRVVILDGLSGHEELEASKLYRSSRAFE